MIKTEFTLVLPGWSAILERDINRSALPKYFSKIIKKSSKQPHQAGLMRVLMRLLTGEALLDNDIPVTHWLTQKRHCIKADPCYLHADRDKLLLFAKDISLSKEQSQQLIAEIQPLIDGIGELSALDDKSWQLTLTKESEIEFTAIEDVEGRAVDQYLPTGQDRRQWVTLWNEIQMQLYQSDVNQERIANQQHPINSVWFWGAGEVSSHLNHWTSIMGSNTTLAALVQKTSDYDVVLSEEISIAAKGKQLIVLPELDIEGDWQQQLLLWDDNIFKPLWQRLSLFSCLRLTLDVPQFAQYQLTPQQRWLKM